MDPCRLIGGKSQRGRYVAGYIQTKRATITTALTIAAEIASSEIEYLPMRVINVRACSPVMRNTMPSMR